MKRFLNLLVTLSFVGVAVNAQSTMPAMGTNTPKGEVAKTDASVNQTSATDKSNASTKKMSTSGKQVHKTKTIKSKTMGIM